MELVAFIESQSWIGSEPHLVCLRSQGKIFHMHTLYVVPIPYAVLCPPPPRPVLPHMNPFHANQTGLMLKVPAQLNEQFRKIIRALLDEPKAQISHMFCFQPQVTKSLWEAVKEGIGETPSLDYAAIFCSTGNCLLMRFTSTLCFTSILQKNTLSLWPLPHTWKYGVTLAI